MHPVKARPAIREAFHRFGVTDFALDSGDELAKILRESDWVELGQLGAYGACLQTGFNGFGRSALVEVADPPMLATPGYEAA
jgi:ornithine decarboxylase